MSSRRLGAEVAILGVLCYGALFLRAPVDDTVIELGAAALDGVVERQEELLGRSLTEEERADAKRAHIDEEILVREAFRRGLDRSDGEARRMLLEHASREIARNANYDPPPPTSDELLSYFEDEASRYVIAERVDMEQVSFPLGTAPNVLADALTELEGDADSGNTGGAGPARVNLREVTLSRIAGAFGVDVAAEIFALPIGKWHGPFESDAGAHFFRVTNRWPSRALSFEEVARYIEEDFRREGLERVVDRELERIRRRYRVVIEDGE